MSSHIKIESILVDFDQNLYSKDKLDLRVQENLIHDLEFVLSDSEWELTKDELFAALEGL